MLRYCLIAIIAGIYLQQTFSADPFSCDGRPAGYYADIASDCQQYHVCNGGKRQYTYSCPNTTRFQQRMMICDHEYLVDCGRSEQDFSANLLIGQRGVPFVRAEELLPKKSSFQNRQSSVFPKPLSQISTSLRAPQQKSNSFPNPRPTSGVTSYFFQKSAGTTLQVPPLLNRLGGGALPRPFTQAPASANPLEPTPARSFTVASARPFSSVTFSPFADSNPIKPISDFTKISQRGLFSPSKAPSFQFKTTPTPFPKYSPTTTPKLPTVQLNSFATSAPPTTLPSSFSQTSPSSPSFPPSFNYQPPFPSPQKFIPKNLTLSASKKEYDPSAFQDDNALDARSLRHPTALRLEWTLPDTRAMLYIPDHPEDAVVPNIKKFSVTIPQPRMNFKETSGLNLIGPCPANCNPAFIQPGSCLPCVIIK